MKRRTKPKVKVRMSGVLRHLSELTGEPELLEVAAHNSVECLGELVKRYPSVKKWAYDKDGKLLPLIWFYVNGREVSLSEFAKPLKEGDDVLVVFAKV